MGDSSGHILSSCYQPANSLIEFLVCLNFPEISSELSVRTGLPHSSLIYHMWTLHGECMLATTCRMNLKLSHWANIRDSGSLGGLQPWLQPLEPFTAFPLASYSSRFLNKLIFLLKVVQVGFCQPGPKNLLKYSIEEGFENRLPEKVRLKVRDSICTYASTGGFPLLKSKARQTIEMEPQLLETQILPLI